MKEYNSNEEGSMLSFNELAGCKSENVLETAKHYINLGQHATPLDGKQPLLAGWPTRKLSEDQLEAHLKDDRNIGIVLGGVYGLVDVDLDHPYAVEVAKHLLPDTLTCGRESRPHSHRLYLCDPIPANRSYALTPAMASELGLDSERPTLVEIRGEGQQIVAPPSIHPVDGDRYLWHEGEIARLDGAKLEELVSEVAIATLLALHWR